MNKKKLTKLQRGLALVLVILLAALYIVTLISAIFTTKAAPQLFKACVFATIVLPFMLYAYILVYRILKQKGESMAELNDEIKTDASKNEIED